jgi:hypothetical protein
MGLAAEKLVTVGNLKPEIDDGVDDRGCSNDLRREDPDLKLRTRKGYPHQSCPQPQSSPGLTIPVASIEAHATILAAAFPTIADIGG